MSAPSPGSNSVAVRVRGLRKSSSGNEVLHGLDLEIGRGEIFVIMGPSGSGKSVLLRQLIGLEEPDAGEIEIEGQPILDEGVHEKYRLAMVFQSGALLNSLTVGENVGLYLSEHRLKPPGEITGIVREKLELLGLNGVEDKMPAELSGGMKKRVAIARALVVEPQLILYDEPTSELDPLSASVIGREILHLRDHVGATSVVVTHDRELAFGIADRIAMMHEGTICEIGPPDAIRHSASPNVQNFLQAEFRPPGAPVKGTP